MAAVSDLIDDRNRLAHRFLREQQVGADFRPGTLAWLGDAGERFDASTHALGEELASGGSYEGAVRPHWPALGDALVQSLFAGDAVDYRTALRLALEDTKDA